MFTNFQHPILKMAPININLISLLGYAMAGVSVFLSVFYLLKNKLKNDGYFLLYTILLLIALELSYKTLIHSGVISVYPFLFIAGRYHNLLLYPCFLFFIWSITKSGFIPRKSWRFILFPFLAYVLYALIQWLSIDLSTKKQMITQFYADKRPGPFNYWGNLGTILKSVLVPLFFLIPISYSFFRFRKKHTNQADKRLVALLSIVIISYFHFIQFSNLIYGWLYQISGYSMIEWPVDIVFLSLISILLNSLCLLVNSGSTLFPEIKYAGSFLDKKTYQEIFGKVKGVIEKGKLFLNHSITINEVSEKLGINSKYISQVINKQAGMSFTAFINTYRVEEAKRQLLDPANQRLTLEAIGNKSGFRSKSTFFTTFKKFTGQTPSEFMKSAKKEF